MPNELEIMRIAKRVLAEHGWPHKLKRDEYFQALEIEHPCMTPASTITFTVTETDAPVLPTIMSTVAVSAPNVLSAAKSVITEAVQYVFQHRDEDDDLD